MNVRVLSRGSDLIAAAAEEAGGPRSDASDTLVVFPGRRPAHFLRRALAAGGAGFRPPRILSMDELVEDVFDAMEGAPRLRLEAIDAVAILYGIQKESPAPLGGDSFLTLDAFFPLGMRIAGDLEDLLIEGVEPPAVSEVQTLISEGVPAPTRARLQSMRLFYERFYAEVRGRGFSTRAMRYRAVAEAVAPLDRWRTVVFAGFFALTGAEKALFRRLARMPSVRFVFHDGPGMVKKLAELGFPSGGGPTARETGPEIHFTSSPDSHGQVFALNAALREPDEGTVIVLPAPESLFPLLRGCLSRFAEEEYNISLGYPLTRTPIHGFLSDLMDLVSSMDGGRVYLPDYLRFLLHPYTKNVLFHGSAEATRVLFHALQERLTSRRRVFLSLEEIESDAVTFDEAAAAVSAGGTPALAEELRGHLRMIHDTSIRRFLSFPTVRDFAERCMELVSFVHGASTARSHPFFTPFSEAFVRALRDISRSLLAGMSFSDIGGYFSLFRRYLATRHFPFPGTPLRGLQVLGSLETRGLPFRRVIVLDANEGSLPEGGADASLLPFAVRTALGLPTYRDREGAAEYHFDTLVSGAQEVRLFFVEGAGEQRSRFAERLIWERQKLVGLREGERAVRPVQYRVNLENRPPGAVAKGPDMVERLRGFAFSATSLDAYLACPLRFYHSRVLGLGKREEASGEIDRADIGTFVHAVLARYLEGRAGRPLGPGDIDPRAMGTLVGELFAARYGAADAGAGRLLKRQVESRLQELLTRFFSPLIQRGLGVTAIEQTVAARRGPFALRGRIDAILERGGAPWLVDYKTGWDPRRYRIRFDLLEPLDRASWTAAIGSLQLPLYVTLASEALGRQPEEVSASFLLLGRRTLDAGVEVPLFDEEYTPSRQYPRIMQVVDLLLAEIVDPGVPFEPTPDRTKACPRCDFVGICGTQWMA